MLDLRPEAALTEHRVLVQVRGAEEGGDHRVRLARSLPDFSSRAFEQPRVERDVDFGARLRGGQPGRVVPLRLQELGMVDHLREPAPVRPHGGRHLDVAVGAGEDASDTARGRGARPRRPIVDPPGEAVGHDRRAAPVDAVELDIQEGDVDALGDAVDLGRLDSAEGADRGHGAALDEGGSTAHLERLTLDGTVREHLATHGVEHCLGEGVVAVGAVPAEVREREDVHVGDPADGIGRQVQALGDGGRVAGDGDVGARQEAFEEFAPAGSLQVEDYRLLVGVEELIRPTALGAGLVVEPRAEGADGIAARDARP